MLNLPIMYVSNMTVNTDIITTTCGRELDLSRTELIIERSNSLFSYNIHKMDTGEYVIAEKFFANPFNNRYILLNDEQIEMLKHL
ncbi:hypothetical protein K3G39_07545 [Pontibacter sp. HSC-14F20]|uniref:hypothetical protein n=1 Tax=Pontibacter sp. HSC-14F20 TaxID=2864136 RepID=UPI001C73C2D1|nr:hypothetical protein [Pontibacter sp. HSC-14F20]MBX0333087.1 hypothetical protein [Pontibacter sp. HSC-14F20]